MAAEVIKVSTVTLAHHYREDKVHVSHIEKPYGDYSSPVVRIDRVECGKVTGLIEIPYENLEEVIESLHKAEELCDSIPHNETHGELNADEGGGGA